MWHCVKWKEMLFFFSSKIHINVVKLKAANKLCGFENPSFSQTSFSASFIIASTSPNIPTHVAGSDYFLAPYPKKKPCFGEHSWFWKSTQGLSGKVRFFSTTTPRVAQSTTTTTTTTTSWNKRSLLLPQCFPCKSQSQIMSILPWKRTTHFEIFKNSVWLTDPPLAESEKFNRGPRPRVERIAKSRGQSITGVLRKEVFWNTGRENVHIQQHV